MKKCSKCNEVKELTEFNKRTFKTKIGVQPYCKKCSHKVRTEHYRNNRDKERSTRNSYANKTRVWLSEFKKNSKCAKCQDSRWYVLDFHHLDKNEKDFNISESMTFSLETLKKEIDKCIVLCSNCHRELHHFEKINNGAVA